MRSIFAPSLLLVCYLHLRCANSCVLPSSRRSSIEWKTKLNYTRTGCRFTYYCVFGSCQRFVVESHFCSSDSYAVCLWLCTRLKGHAQHINGTTIYYTQFEHANMYDKTFTRARERVSIDTVSPYAIHSFRVVRLQVWPPVRTGCVRLELYIS